MFEVGSFVVSWAHKYDRVTRLLGGRRVCELWRAGGQFDQSAMRSKTCFLRLQKHWQATWHFVAWLQQSVIYYKAPPPRVLILLKKRGMQFHRVEEVNFDSSSTFLFVCICCWHTVGQIWDLLFWSYSSSYWCSLTVLVKEGHAKTVCC